MVWAHSVGLVTNKDTAERAQRTSFYGWLLASLCTLAVDLSDLARLSATRDAASAALAAQRSSSSGGGASDTKDAAAAAAADDAGVAKAKDAVAEKAAVEALRVVDDALRGKLVSAVTMASQAAVAASLLKLVNLSPRQTAALGILSSVLATYQLLPPLPPAPPAHKSKAE